jgi:hypothetical protein
MVCSWLWAAPIISEDAATATAIHDCHDRRETALSVTAEAW